MKTPIFVRSFSDEEREALQGSLRSKDAFTLRRSQILLASSRGEYAPKIAESLGCGEQTVRDAIHDFNQRGLDALIAKSSRPKRTREVFDQRSADLLREMLHRSPREFGHDRVACGLWRWLHRLPSRRGLPTGGSRARPSGAP
jgi:transposase